MRYNLVALQEIYINYQQGKAVDKRVPYFVKVIACNPIAFETLYQTRW